MTTPNYETVLYEVRDQVATVTLNRPEHLNAWTSRLGAELGDAMAEADEDDGVRAVIVTGAGRAFCAGATCRAASSVVARPRFCAGVGRTRCASR